MRPSLSQFSRASKYRLPATSMRLFWPGTVSCATPANETVITAAARLPKRSFPSQRTAMAPRPWTAGAFGTKQRLTGGRRDGVRWRGEAGPALGEQLDHKLASSQSAARCNWIPAGTCRAGARSRAQNWLSIRDDFTHFCPFYKDNLELAVTRHPVITGIGQVMRTGLATHSSSLTRRKLAKRGIPLAVRP
jgi:hypothetical protein